MVQRANSDLRLNPHIHAIVLDGVFVPDNSTPVFPPLPHLDTSDLADVLQVIRVRILNYLVARNVIENRHELTLLDDGFAEREPALAQLAAAAVTGLLPAGPDIRQRQPIALRGEPGVEVTAPLSVTEMGFSLHAATTASAEDSRGREALVRYALRPPIAQERLHILPDNLVRIELKPSVSRRHGRHRPRPLVTALPVSCVGSAAGVSPGALLGSTGCSLQIARARRTSAATRVED